MFFSRAKNQNQDSSQVSEIHTSAGSFSEYSESSHFAPDTFSDGFSDSINSSQFSELGSQYSEYSQVSSAVSHRKSNKKFIVLAILLPISILSIAVIFLLDNENFDLNNFFNDSAAENIVINNQPQPIESPQNNIQISSQPPLDQQVASASSQVSQSTSASDALASSAPLQTSSATQIQQDTSVSSEQKHPQPSSSDAQSSPAQAHTSLPSSQQGVSLATLGPESSAKPWEALEIMERWMNAGEVNTEALKQYFAHKKAWVRLTALELSLRTKCFSDAELAATAQEIAKNFDKRLIQRFMKRVRVRSPDIYGKMQGMLQGKQQDFY